MSETTSLHRRPFREQDEAVVRALRKQSFGAPLDIRTWLEHGHVLELRGSVIAALLARRVGQWFGGKPVPCVAVSSVMVDLPRRSGGVMASLLEPVLENVGHGAVISTLTPSSMAPYRRAGYEVAGFRFRHHVASRSLRPARETDDVRWYEQADTEHLAALYEAFAQCGNGPIRRSPDWWHSQILPAVRSGDAFAIVAERDGVPTGYAVWDQVGSPRPGEYAFYHRVRAREIVWTSAPAAQGLLRALAQAGTPGEDLSWFGGPSDGLAVFFDDPVLMDWAHPWATRILDLPGALAARGYPAGLDVALVLEVRGAAGRHRVLRLEVAGGSAVVEEVAGEPELVLDESALVSIYTGRTSTREAHALGQLHARASPAVAALDALFSGTAPWLFEHF